MGHPLANVVQEAERILAAADEAGLPLRVLGGVAVALRCPSAAHRSLQREYHDIDLVTRANVSRQTQALFADLGYEADKAFNTLHARERLLFWDPKAERQVDVFIDVLRMCHSLDLRERLDADQRTIPLADLLLSKFQIVELNDKDVMDLIALLEDQPLAHSDDDGINLDRVVDVLSTDWGFYRTSKETAARVRAVLARDDPGGTMWKQAASRLDQLWEAVEAAPKSRGWKLRAAIGERKRWYNLPEEVRRD